MSETAPDAKAAATIPPDPMREACREGLSHWAEHGRTLAKSAKRRAENLAAGQPLTANMLGRLRTFFAKHAPGAELSEPQRVELLLAGGEPGRAWVEQLCRASAASPTQAREAPSSPPAPEPPTPEPSPLPSSSTGRVEKDCPRPAKKARPKASLRPQKLVRSSAEPAAPKRETPAPKTVRKASNQQFAAHVYGQGSHEFSRAERIAKTTRDMLKKFLERGRYS